MEDSYVLGFIAHFQLFGAFFHRWHWTVGSYSLSRQRWYWTFSITIEKDCLWILLPYRRHRTGRWYWYLHSQDGIDLSWMCLAVLLSIRISSTRLDAVSMHVSALNSTCLPLTLTFQGPIRSIVTFPKVHSTLLFRVIDHNHGLLTYIFDNPYTSVDQCDSIV